MVLIEGQSLSRKIEILRLDHRTFRDQRITSHVALSSRTFGATGFTYSGEKDDNLEKSISDVVFRWGGKFSVNYTEKIGSFIRSWKGIVVHLTMYGEKHESVVNELKKLPDEDILIILGGAKVPRYVYELSDFNVAIGWQPHSEVAAIAIFLYDFMDRNLLYSDKDGANIKIDPSNSKSKRSDRFTNT